MKGELHPIKNIRFSGGLSCIWMTASNGLIAGRVRGGVLIIMHGRSRMTIDPRIPTMPGQSTLGFQPPLLAPGAKRREVFGESHEG